MELEAVAVVVLKQGETELKKMFLRKCKMNTEPRAGGLRNLLKNVPRPRSFLLFLDILDNFESFPKKVYLQ